MIRILIVDDSDSIRRQLRRMVERHPGWTVCGEAVDGREAILQAVNGGPDIILLDYRLPILNGLQAAREISRLVPAARILLCSMHCSPDLFRAAREAGIHGAVSKCDGRQIVSAVEALLRHETFFSDSEATIV